MTLSISEVAAATGVRASALRYYEEVGLIQPTGRRAGRRHYDPDVLSRLGLIALCQDAGLKIAEIAELLDGRPQVKDRWRTLAASQLEAIDRRIARLESMRGHLEAALACECGQVQGCDLVAAAADRRRVAHSNRPRRDTSRTGQLVHD